MKNNNKFTRRDFIKTVGLSAAVLSSTAYLHSQNLQQEKTKSMLVYIGTYTSSGKSEGIYIYKFNPVSGDLMPYKVVKNVVEPSFLTIDKSHKFLYAVNETEEFEGKKSGAVSAFAIDRKTGDLSFLNKQPSLGGAPCYITVGENGKFVLVANYVGGNIAVFPVEAGGKLGASVDLEQFAGSSVNKDRQESAHAHSIVLDRENRFAFANDLGTDKVMIYQFDDKTGKLETNPAQPFYHSKPGAGPRHFAFHPNDKFAFIINELDSSVTSLAYDKTNGTLKEIQTVSTLPPNFSGENTCAEIAVAPSGKFLYGANRGHDSIAAYRIDENGGQLEYIENVFTGGKTPRNFAIDPTGNFILAANQNSDNIVIFRIDEKSGKLTPTGKIAAVPTPVCLDIIPDFTS